MDKKKIDKEFVSWFGMFNCIKALYFYNFTLSNFADESRFPQTLLLPPPTIFMRKQFPKDYSTWQSIPQLDAAVPYP